MNDIKEAYNKLNANGKGRWINDNKFTCCCPVHEDRSPSAFVQLTDNGNLWLGCSAGCNQDDLHQHMKSLGFNELTQSASKETSSKHRSKKIEKPVNKDMLYPANLKKYKEERLKWYNEKLNQGYRDQLSNTTNKYIFPYLDYNFNFYGFILRDQDKNFAQYTPHLVEDQLVFKAQGWSTNGRALPLFLKWDTDKPKEATILHIYEGEKTTLAGRHLFPEDENIIHASWPTGCGNAAKADWSLVSKQNFKEVILFPDNDDQGSKAMQTVANIINKIKPNLPISILDFHEYPDKYDIADSFVPEFKPEECSKVLKVYEARVQSEVQLDREWVYVNHIDQFYDLSYQLMISPQHFTRLTMHTDMSARKFLMGPLNPRYDKLDFSPFKKRVFKDGGLNILNTYRDLRPPLTVAEDDAIIPKVYSAVDKLLKHLCPDDLHRHHLTQWIAQVIQHPGVKIKHAVMLISEVEGNGKSTVGEMIKEMLGAKHCREINQHQITSRFNKWAFECLFVQVEEIAIKGKYGERSAQMDLFKTLITSPTIELEAKGKDTMTITNTINPMFMSNNKSALTIPDNARRYFIIECLRNPMPDAFYKEFYGLLKKFPGVFVKYFMEYSLEGFDKEKKPPKTNAFYEMADRTKAPMSQTLDELLEDIVFPFTDLTDLVCPRHIADCLKRKGTIKDIHSNNVCTWLLSIGAKKIKQLNNWNANDQRPTIWALSNIELYEEMTPDELANNYIQPIVDQYGKETCFVDRKLAKVTANINDLDAIASRMNG